MSTKRFVIIAKTYCKKGKLLAVGTNSYEKTSPQMKYFAEAVGLPDKQYLHAEVQALLRSRDKAVYKLTVERYTSDGEPAMAKPCLVCQEAVKAYGVKVVEYTTSDGWVKEFIS